MLFQSGQLFFCILLFITVFVVCKWVFRKGWLNNVVLLLGNALVLTNIVRPQSVLILLIVAVVCYGAGVLLQRKKWRWLLALTLVLLVALFAIRSYPLVWKWFGEFWTTNMKKHFFSVEKLGLSYILFRLVHWLVECRRGTLRTHDFLTYINYLFFFPTFMAGPIDTLNNFHYWMHTTRVRFNARMLLAGVGRIFLGAVKALLVVPLMLPYATDYQTLLPHMGPWGAVLCAALLYSLYIYIDFSGYCDMAIGMACMMGIRTPENFNNPYLSANIAEFWKRWHITFSTFLKIYVFKPVIGLLNRFPIRKCRMMVSVIAYMLTFFVCGLWHGCTLNFVLWGLWHGLGLSLYKIAIGIHSPKPTRLNRVLGIAATFLFVTVGWILFNYPMDELCNMIKLLFG